MRSWVWMLFLVGCGGSTGGDAGSADAGEMETCAVACDDGLFCNGAERCAPSATTADEDGCAPADDVPCPGICDEAADRCGGCELTPDADADGHDAIGCGGDDCDDADPERFPGAVEVCDPSNRDEDCDPTTFGGRDADGDGAIDIACCNGDTCGTDCDDRTPSVHPGANEVCNGLDEDCDGAFDEGAQLPFYEDADGDDFGSADGEVRMACSVPAGFSANDRDCNDTTSAVNPGVSEICDAFDDNDCNATTNNVFDTDGDGHDAFDATSCPAGLDCDPSDSNVYDGAPEICDGKDSDCGGGDAAVCAESCGGTCIGTCVGSCSEELPNGECALCMGSCVGNDGGPGLCLSGCTAPLRILAEDADGDDFLAIGETCSGGPLDGLPRTDCDDFRDYVYPGARELCDRLDGDCDGAVDEGFFEGVSHPDVPIRLGGGGAPNLACRGVRTRPAPGASTVTAVAVLRLNDAQPLTDMAVQVWTTEDASSATCSAPDCTSYTTDFGGVTVVTHPSGAVLGYRIPGTFPPTLGELDTSRTSVAFYPPATFTGSSIAARVVDCDGMAIEHAQVRVVREDGLPNCDQGTSESWGYGARIRPMIAPGEGEVVTVETRGRLTMGGALELLGRERVRVVRDWVSVVVVPPLRADGPPAP